MLNSGNMDIESNFNWKYLNFSEINECIWIFQKLMNAFALGNVGKMNLKLETLFLTKTDERNLKSFKSTCSLNIFPKKFMGTVCS